jgi:hypothetical protein
MPDTWAARCSDRRGAVVGGESGLGREPGWVTDVSEDQTGDDWSDAVHVEQRGVRRVDGVGDAGLDRDEIAVQATDIGEHLERDPILFDPDRLNGADRAQQLRRTISRQSTRCTTRDELPQRGMQPARGPSSSRHEIVVTTDQQSQDRGVECPGLYKTQGTPGISDVREQRASRQRVPERNLHVDICPAVQSDTPPRTRILSQTSADDAASGHHDVVSSTVWFADPRRW